MKNEITYHFVSQSHWDREWVLSFEEYRVMLVDFWDALFELFEKDPDFKHFMTDGQMQMVMDYLEVKPQNFEKIRNLVNSGRLSIGPWYIQIDQFLPSGESHVRNLTIGFKMAKIFGEPMKIGYIPDQFGHISQMPQILNGFDIDTAVIYRGFGGEPGQEFSEYVWRAPDGSQVLMIHLPKDGYSFGYFAIDSEEMILKRFERLKEEIDKRAQTSHRLILNGGDHHWPDYQITKALKILKSTYPNYEFIHSTLENYINCVKSEIKNQKLPEWVGETRFGLKHAFAVIGGTASSRIYIKQENYNAQIKLEKILEPLNAIAFLLKNKNRTELINLAWLYCLQNQDHDTINGTAVDRVYKEAIVRYLKIDEIFKSLSFQISNDLFTYDSRFYGDDTHIFVFNFLPFGVSKLAKCEVEFHLQDVIVGLNPDVKPTTKSQVVSGFKIINSNGGEIKYQILNRAEKYSIVWGYHEYPHQILVDSFDILLDVENLPSLGWEKFNIVKTNSFPKYETNLKVGFIENTYFIENEFLRVDISENGSLKITDKINLIEFENLNIFEESGDVGDEYNYCFPDNDEVYYSTDFKPEIAIVESGPLRAGIQVRYLVLIPEQTFSYGRSSEKVEMEIVSNIYLEHNSRRVDIKTKVNNKAKNHRIRVLFITGLNTNISYADSQFCIVKRVHRKYNWDEYPYEKPLNLEVLQRFVCIQDENKGIAIFTRGLHEYELSLDKPGQIAITLLRGVGQLSESNLKTRPGGDAGWKNETPDAQCLGIYEFEYSIFLYRSNDFKSVNTQAEIYHSPNFTVKRKNLIQNLSKFSMLNIDGDNIVLSALKTSEDGRGIILRLYNPTNNESIAKLKLNFDYKELSLAKLSEIKVKKLEPENEEAFLIGVPPFKILTFKIEI
ncbi:MAG: glycosyl hydrolase-related protein [Candidatus Kryptonium sp.]|nr:glycosyl hydrolase-related protein [Candidatus Kryptonium sp.]